MNDRLIKDFKAHLEECEKTTHSSPMYVSGFTFTPKTRVELIRLNDGHNDFEECGENPTSYSDATNLFFYEFSALDKGCKHFYSLKSFFSWAESCGIKIEYQVKNSINISNSCWVFCIPGQSDAIAKNSREGVRKLLAKYENGESVTPYDKSFYN